MSRFTLLLLPLGLAACDTFESITVVADVRAEAIADATSEAPWGVFVGVESEFDSGIAYTTLIHVLCEAENTDTAFVDSGRGCSTPRDVTVWLAPLDAALTEPCGATETRVEAMPSGFVQTQEAFAGGDEEECTSASDQLNFVFRGDPL